MELRYCEKCRGIIVLEGGHGEFKPLEDFTCAHCQAGGAGRGHGQGKPSGEVSTALKTFFEQGELNLFSPGSVVVRKGTMAMDSGAEGSSEEQGCSSPARTAKRIQFHCLYCKAMLQTKPVETPSRVVCPKCRGLLFIDRRGFASKTPPAGAGEAKVETSSILQAGFRKTSRPEAKLLPEPAPDLENA